MSFDHVLTIFSGMSHLWIWMTSVWQNWKQFLDHFRALFQSILDWFEPFTSLFWHLLSNVVSIFVILKWFSVLFGPFSYTFCPLKAILKALEKQFWPKSSVSRVNFSWFSQEYELFWPQIHVWSWRNNNDRLIIVCPRAINETLENGEMRTWLIDKLNNKTRLKYRKRSQL